jgi:hypothetical protein
VIAPDARTKPTYLTISKNLCARCLIEYEDKGKLIDKTKYDGDGEPYMED